MALDLQHALENNHTFFTELVNHNGLPTVVEIVKKLEEHQSLFQKVEIYETRTFGTTMVLDGVIQLTERDTFNYMEMIAHVPLMAHPNPQKVLIVGGGDCGTLTAVLQHSCVQEVVMCEIDGVVVEMAKKYFPQFARAMEDSRATTIVQDAIEFVKTKKNYFDVVIVDSSDPFGPAEGLFNEFFYEDVKSALTDDGIVVSQAEPMFFYQSLIKRMYQQNRKLFKHVHYYYTLVPTYPSGSIGFLFSSKKYNYYENMSVQRMKNLKGLMYYNEEIHRASFCLPQYLKNALEDSSI